MGVKFKIGVPGLSLTTGGSSLFTSIHLTLPRYVTRHEKKCYFYLKSLVHIPPFLKLCIFVCHLLKESKEQLGKARPFIRVFLYLNSSLILCLACLVVLCHSVIVYEKHCTLVLCHNTCMPYDMLAVSYHTPGVT